LGTGVGSGSLVGGRVVSEGPDFPPGGRAHRLLVDGRPLEDVMSRRALIRAYRLRSGEEIDVREISERARAGDATASAVITEALAKLGLALAPWLSHFDVVVLGGSMTKSWDVMGPPFVGALRAAGLSPEVIVADGVEASALIGAAWSVSQARKLVDADQDPWRRRR